VLSCWQHQRRGLQACQRLEIWRAGGAGRPGAAAEKPSISEAHLWVYTMSLSLLTRWPAPRSRKRVVMRPSTPTGPRAWMRAVEMPTCADVGGGSSSCLGGCELESQRVRCDCSVHSVRPVHYGRSAEVRRQEKRRWPQGVCVVHSWCRLGLEAKGGPRAACAFKIQEMQQMGAHLGAQPVAEAV